MAATRPWFSVSQQRTIKQKLRDHSAAALAVLYSCPLSEIFAARDELPSSLRYHSQINYMPSPGEIAAACIAIQQGWSVREERSRRGFRVGDDYGAVELQIVDSRGLETA